MSAAALFNFIVDKETQKIKVERSFKAPLDLVWSAWTEPEILDQWWAPKPWKAETKEMDFAEGGHWLYAMVGPDGSKQWCLFDYQSISPQKNYSGVDAFCDENRVVEDTKPRVYWNNTFKSNGETTLVSIDLRFDDLAGLESILEMGFKEGFTMGLGNLDEWLAENQ